MKIKNVILISAIIITSTIVGCNGGADINKNGSANNININLSNKLVSANDDGLLVTNPSSKDINWGNDSLVNIPIGSKGLKAIKVTNISSQAFSNLTLETSANKPSNITIDNSRTTCSMGIPLAVNASCLYVFNYNPVGGYESGTFTANVSADHSDNKVKVSINVDYSTRVSENAGTLAVNVDTSALNCNETSCSGTLYVVNSKGAKVSTVVNITGNNGTIFGSGLVNLNSNDSYTIEASPINGSIPLYSPNQTVNLVANQTTTVTVKYPTPPVNFGKAVITLPNVLPSYTGTLGMQILNTKNGGQVIDSENLKQGETMVIDLPISDSTHAYVVKLVNGIADPLDGLFYDQEAVTPLEIKDSGSSNLSILMKKATSLSDIELKVSGIDYDVVSISFSDADGHYKYVNQYNQSNGSKKYKIKTGLSFSIQTQASGSGTYKINPIINTFTVAGAKSVFAAFQLSGVNKTGSVKINLKNSTSLGSYSYTEGYTGTLPIQILNIKNNKQIVKEVNLKLGDSIIVDEIPVTDESHDYVVKLPYGIADPSKFDTVQDRDLGTGFYWSAWEQPLVIRDNNLEQLSINGWGRSSYVLPVKIKISGLKSSDTADVMFSGDGDVKWKYVNSYNQINGQKTYYLAPPSNIDTIVYTYTIKVQVTDATGYQVNPIVKTFSSSSIPTNLDFEFK